MFKKNFLLRIFSNEDSAIENSKSTNSFFNCSIEKAFLKILLFKFSHLNNSRSFSFKLKNEISV
jgi:hypothetical protein